MHQEEELKFGEEKKLLEDEKAQFVEKKGVTESIQSQVSVSSPVSLKAQGLQKVSHQRAMRKFFTFTFITQISVIF